MSDENQGSSSISANAGLNIHLISGLMTFFFKLFIIFQNSCKMRQSYVTRSPCLQYQSAKWFQEVSKFTGLHKFNLTAYIQISKLSLTVWQHTNLLLRQSWHRVISRSYVKCYFPVLLHLIIYLLLNEKQKTPSEWKLRYTC